MGDHDTLFKRAFSVPEHAAGELRSVLPASVLERLDLSNLELVPASFVDAEMSHRHVDLLFQAPFGDKTAYVYLLLEHQSEPDALMAFRVDGYVHRIWASVVRREPNRRTLPLVITVVVHHGRGGWTAARSVHELVERLDELPELAPFVPNVSLLVDDLVHVDDGALQSRPMSTFPRVTLWLLRDAREVDALLESLSRWGEELEEVARRDPHREDTNVILRYILRVAGDIPYETLRERIIEVAPITGESMASPAEQLIQQGVQQGIQQGVEQGVQQGIQQGMRSMLTRQLRARFGALDAATETRIVSAPPEELEQWLERVLTAETLDDVFAS